MKTRVTIRKTQSELAESTRMFRLCSFCLFLLLLAAALYPVIALASPGEVIFKSALTWRSDDKGDYQFDKKTFSFPGTYEISSGHKTDGIVSGLTVSWKSTGQVSLEVSADNGTNYTPVVCGRPLKAKKLGEGEFIKGSLIRWKATLGSESVLSEVRISYSDSSGVVGMFGEPKLSGFKLRKPLFIANSGSQDLFNYQLQIKVGESATEAADADCQVSIEADFADVRFTCVDGQTLLPYYLEKIDGSYPNRVATFWVKIPQIPFEGLPIYIYYGNLEAKDLSSGEDTFDFFDDFSGDDLDLSKWELTQGSYLVSDSQIKLENAEIISKDYLAKDGIIEYRARTGAGNEVRLIARSEKDDSLAEANQIAYSSSYSGIEHCLAVGDIVKVNQASSLSSGSTYDYRMILDGTNLTFQRYSQGFLDLEAETVYDDRGGLTSGSIGLEVGTDCVSYFDWVRVRKYLPDTIAVDKQAGQLAAAEQVDLPDFQGLSLSENGNLILEEDYTQGLYTSRTVALADEARIFASSYKIVDNRQSTIDDGLSIDISMDGGGDYATNCLPGKFYYASKGDFSAGDAWKFKLSLQANKLTSDQLSEVSVDYRSGRILLITPNGGETWPRQQQKEIAWTALDYEPGYEMKLEYSLDSGKTYAEIIKTTKNTGRYLWTVPDVTSRQALVRFSDLLDPSVFDISDQVFTISAEEVIAEEEAEAEEAEAEEVHIEGIDLEKLIEQGERLGTQLYDVVIKLGDNYNSDPEKDSQGSYKHGDVVIIRPSGYLWSETERNSFLIVQVYLTEAEKAALIRPKETSTGKLDRTGRPIMKISRRRAKRFQLEELGLSKTDRKEQKLGKVRNRLKKKTLKRRTIKEKE